MYFKLIRAVLCQKIVLTVYILSVSLSQCLQNSNSNSSKLAHYITALSPPPNDYKTGTNTNL